MDKSKIAHFSICAVIIFSSLAVFGAGFAGWIMTMLILGAYFMVIRKLLVG